MSIVRKVVTVMLTMLLATTLVTANVVAAAHLTVLDPGFVTDTVEEEGGYELVQDTTVDTVSQSVNDSDFGETVPGSVDTQELVRDSIEEEYLRAQTERNVDRLYAYLHGNTDTLNLSINTAPVKENVSDAAEAQIRNISVGDVLERTNVSLPAETERFVNESMIRRMPENESAYGDVKRQFRHNVRSVVLDEAVTEAYSGSSNDEKLALIIPDYDPRDYSESEKERMVADNETEIRSAMRERIERERGDEIDQGVNETLTELNGTVSTNATGGNLSAASQRITAIYVEGLTTDTTYDEFSADLQAVKADLAANLVERAKPMIDEQVPDRISLTSELGPEVTTALEPVRTAVTWIDRLAFILPALALLLVGLIYFVNRSFQTVASSAGFGLLSAGLPIYLSLGFLQSFLEKTVETEIEKMQKDSAVAGLEELADLLLGIVGQILGRIGAVSLAFVLAGLALLAVWLVFRFDVISGGSGGSDASGGSGGSGEDAGGAEDGPDETAESDDATTGAATADAESTAAVATADATDAEAGPAENDAVGPVGGPDGTGDPLADAGDDSGGDAADDLDADGTDDSDATDEGEPGGDAGAIGDQDAVDELDGGSDADEE